MNSLSRLTWLIASSLIIWGFNSPVTAKTDSTRNSRFTLSYDVGGLLLHALPGSRIGYISNAIQVNYDINSAISLGGQIHYEYAHQKAKYGNVSVRYNGLGSKVMLDIKPSPIIWFSGGILYGAFWQEFYGELSAINFYSESFSDKINGQVVSPFIRGTLCGEIGRVRLLAYAELLQININTSERVTKVPGAMLKLMGPNTFGAYLGFNLGYRL